MSGGESKERAGFVGVSWGAENIHLQPEECPLADIGCRRFSPALEARQQQYWPNRPYRAPATGALTSAPRSRG